MLIFSLPFSHGIRMPQSEDLEKQFNNLLKYNIQHKLLITVSDL